LNLLAVLGLAFRASFRCHLAALVVALIAWWGGLSLGFCLAAMGASIGFTTLETAIEGVLWARRKTRELALLVAAAEIMRGEEPSKEPPN
jgi:hypothetical protein